MQIFETARTIVRQYTVEDADAFFALNSNPEVMHYIRPVKDRAGSDLFLAENLQAYQANPAFGRWSAGLKRTGAIIGSFAIIPLRNTSDWQLGYALFPNYWGMGLATELTLAGIEYAFTRAGLRQIYAVTEAKNIASRQVLQKTGFSWQRDVESGPLVLKEYVLINNAV